MLRHVGIRLFTLLMFIFLAASTAAKTTYTAVPGACENILRGLAKTRPKAPVLKDDVDWTPLHENMKELGYPPRIAAKKLREDIEWDKSAALALIRLALDKPDWRWGTPFTIQDSRKIGESASYNNLITSLPIWDSLNGFDSGEAVYGFLRSENHLSEDAQKAMAQFAPLWVRGRRGLDSALMFYEGTKDEQGHIWALQISHNLENRDRLMRAIRSHIRSQGSMNAHDTVGESANPSLQLLSALPYAELPTSFRKYLEGFWVDLENYRPLRLDEVRHIANGEQYAGDCEMMTNGHLRTLGLNCDRNDEEWKESVLVRVKGHIVGSMKMVGDPSMIALRNVKNSRGELVLALGGVYHLSKDAHDALEKRGRKAFRGWRVVDFDELEVKPATFMLNENAWSNGNAVHIFSAVQDVMSKQELLDVMRKSSDYGDFDDAFQNDMHARVWFQILKGLDRFRRSQE